MYVEIFLNEERRTFLPLSYNKWYKRLCQRNWLCKSLIFESVISVRIFKFWNIKGLHKIRLLRGIRIFEFKGTVSVISNGSPHRWQFPIHPLTLYLIRIYLIFLGLKVLNSDNFFMFFCSRSVHNTTEKNQPNQMNLDLQFIILDQAKL